MNSTNFFNKAEIALYSTLISIMSGINQLKPHEKDMASYTKADISAAALAPTQVYVQPAGRNSAIDWEALQQSILTLLLWAVLGLAAGFLVGMIRPG